jgi:hypothetical protein
MAALGSWGLRHRPTTATLRVRAELLAEGGPELWADFMDELRAEHLGAPSTPDDRPRATERLAAAHAEAVAAEVTEPGGPLDVRSRRPLPADGRSGYQCG